MHFFRGNEPDNAEGVESSSPGLLVSSYPGAPPPTRINPERVAALFIHR